MSSSPTKPIASSRYQGNTRPSMLREATVDRDAAFSFALAYVMMQRMKIRNATNYLHHHHGRPCRAVVRLASSD